MSLALGVGLYHRVCDVTTVLAAAVAAACLWTLKDPRRLTEAQETNLKLLKGTRVVSFALLSCSQLMAVWLRLLRHPVLWGHTNIQQIAALAAFFTTMSVSVVAWKRQGALKLLRTGLAALLLSSVLLASDCIIPTTAGHQFDGDRIAGILAHSFQIILLLCLLTCETVASVHVDHMFLTTDPLVPEPEKDKDKKKKVQASRMHMARSAFTYVWPNTPKLRMRLTFCFCLVVVERLVNLALPLLYKGMVDTLSKVSVLQQLLQLAAGGGGSSSGGVLNAARDGSSGSSGVTGDPWLAVLHHILPAEAVQAVSSVPFWSVFFPWVFGYLGIFYLRGGSGIEGLLANFRDILWIPITQEAFRRISVDVFGHLLDLDQDFHLHRKTGQIMRILDRGTSSIQDTVSIVLFNVVPQLGDIVVACLYLALKVQPFTAAIVFVTVASYVPLTIIITERRGVIRKRMNALDNARENCATDMLLNYETVKYFCNEKFELARYDAATRQFQAAEYWQMAFLSILSLAQAMVVWLGLAAGMVVCVRGVAGGSLTVGDAVLFITMMNQLYVPLTYFGSYYRQVQKALIDMENMFELLLTQPKVRDPPGAAPLQVSQGQVDFDNVVFGYSPSNPVLKGVSFHVPGGKTLAVVGATGSGKSTILRLLLRFYDPLSGAIRIDGQDIARCSQGSVRRAIAVVPQDSVLFNETVMYNIRYSAVDSTDEEVQQAAAVAHIHDSITTKFKKGYRTRVGERGLRLSGGEKQRVAFARAVLKRPAILLLDEATSALDSLTELHIQASLQAMREMCTTIIVAHRLSTIMDADIILVLDRGHVVQCGSHSQLLEQGGLYSAMWSRQKDVVACSAVDLLGGELSAMARSEAGSGVATPARGLRGSADGGPEGNGEEEVES